MNPFLNTPKGLIVELYQNHCPNESLWASRKRGIGAVQAGREPDILHGGAGAGILLAAGRGCPGAVVFAKILGNMQV